MLDPIKRKNFLSRNELTANTRALLVNVTYVVGYYMGDEELEEICDLDKEEIMREFSMWVEENHIVPDLDPVHFNMRSPISVLHFLGSVLLFVLNNLGDSSKEDCTLEMFPLSKYNEELGTMISPISIISEDTRNFLKLRSYINLVGYYLGMNG